MPISGGFEGTDRIEFCECLGRPFRKGALSALSVSDGQRVRDELAAKNGEAAKLRLDYLHGLHTFMIGGSVEWLLQWPAFIAARMSEDEFLHANESAYELWLTSVEAGETAARIHDYLKPASLNRRAIEDYRVSRRTGEPAILSALLEAPNRSRAVLKDAIAAKRFETAEREFEQYLRQMRTRHDLLMRYIWAYASTANRCLGQAVAEEALSQTLQGCSFNEPMWRLMESLSPADRAALLAEHLRAHFSGTDREGSVEIIEERDRYRLVFAPCGSGGAMRRAKAVCGLSDAEVLQASSPSSWNRHGEVPVYCAHCAQNELASVRRLGYPVWVTEFNPDHCKPCGWSIYKSPDLIPHHCFERLGLSRVRG